MNKKLIGIGFLLIAQFAFILDRKKIEFLSGKLFKSENNISSIAKDGKWILFNSPNAPKINGKSYSLYLDKKSIKKITNNFFPNRFEYEVDYVSSSEFRLPGKQKMRRTIDCEKLSIFLSFGDGENSDWYSVFNNAFLEQEALYVCKNQEDIMEKFAEAKTEIDGWEEMWSNSKIIDGKENTSTKNISYFIHLPSLKTKSSRWIFGKTRTLNNNVNMFSSTFPLKINCWNKYQEYNGELMVRQDNEWFILSGEKRFTRNTSSIPSEFKAWERYYQEQDNYLNNVFDYVCSNKQQFVY